MSELSAIYSGTRVANDNDDSMILICLAVVCRRQVLNNPSKNCTYSKSFFLLDGLQVTIFWKRHVEFKLKKIEVIISIIIGNSLT